MNKAAGKKPPVAPLKPVNPRLNKNYPANLYNGMIKPVLGYGIKGAIWYQGETNASRAYQYRELFPLMIKNWRDEWALGDFPFYYVQLADFMGEKPNPEDSAWAELREAQTMTMSKLPNVGEDVARRLARWALAKDYGVQVPFRSPSYKSMEKKDGKIILTFDFVDQGLRAHDVPEVKGFAIAGSDKHFVWAKAKIVGKDKVEVSAEGITDPEAVRYAWADNPVANLYDRNGLPATPFRTDEWPGVTVNNK